MAAIARNTQSTRGDIGVFVCNEREKHNGGWSVMATTHHGKDVAAHLERVASRGDGLEGKHLLKIAFAYCLQKTPYVFSIVGGRKIDHIQGSIDALNVAPSDKEMAEVEEGYHLDAGFPHTFPSGTMFTGDAPHAASGPGDAFLTKGFAPKMDWVEGERASRPTEFVSNGLL